VGAGVGALTLAAQCPEATVTGTDINPEALRLCRINATHNGMGIALIECSGLPAGPRGFDVIAANPPYVAGKVTRLYRDGGGQLGAGLALDWVEAGVTRLTSGGRFLLYTGSAIVRGQDVIRNALERLAEGRFALEYEEIDPDVFGGTLRQQAYRDVERIAAVGAVLTAP
jgi:methylase of polypeptide subunit release factors